MARVGAPSGTKETSIEAEHDLLSEGSRPQQQAQRAGGAEFSLAPTKPEVPFQGSIEYADGRSVSVSAEDRGGPGGKPNGLIDTLTEERRGAGGRLMETAHTELRDVPVSRREFNTDKDPGMDVRQTTFGDPKTGSSVTQWIADANHDGKFGAHDYFEVDQGGSTMKGYDRNGDGVLSKADGTVDSALGTIQKHMQGQITPEKPTGDRLDEAGLKALAAKGGIVGDAASQVLSEKGLWGKLDQHQNPRDRKDGLVGAGDIASYLARGATAPADPNKPKQGGTQSQGVPKGVEELTRRVEGSHGSADKTEKIHQATKELQLHGIGGIHEGIGAVQKDKAKDLGGYLEGRADGKIPAAQQAKFRAGAQAIDDLVKSYDPKKDAQNLGLLGTTRSKLEDLGLWGDQGVHGKFRDAVTEGAGAVKDVVDREVKKEISGLEQAGRTKEAKELKSRLATLDAYALKKEQIGHAGTGAAAKSQAHHAAEPTTGAAGSHASQVTPNSQVTPDSQVAQDSPAAQVSQARQIAQNRPAHLSVAGLRAQLGILE